MDNPYLTGVYRPVHDERTDTDLEVIGEIPREISGVYLQNNPNPRFEPPGAYHWFDGDGMVHGVELRDGRATYRNRWVHTAGLQADLAAGEALRRGIMEPFDPRNPRPDKNTANTDLVVHDGKVLALWWLGGEPYALRMPDLETLGEEDFSGTLKMGIAAHPKVDPRTGELVFIDYDPYKQPYLRYGVARGDRIVHAADVHLEHPSLMHDLAITENYTILPDFPMVWDPEKLAAGKRRVRFHDRPARFGIVGRHSAEVRWFEASRCYSYHTVNAWEEGDEVVLHACRIETPIPTGPQTGSEREIPRLAFLRLAPVYYEWRFNLRTGTTTERQLDDRLTEFPRMDDRYLGVKTRYSYSQRLAKEPTLLFDGFLRYDTDTGEVLEHGWGDGHVGGEVVFVPRGEDEGDGWVMTYVTNRADDTSELRIVDAITLQTTARVRLPRRVPIGFHAHYAPLEA